MSERSPIARAIDLGFGYVKLARASFEDGSGSAAPLNPLAFPSVAAVSTVDGAAFEGVGLGSLDVVSVTVRGVTFRVGPDALLTLSGSAVSVPGDEFFMSDEYLSLNLGALAYMDLPAASDIDVLAVGLPLTVFVRPDVRKHLVDSLQTTHLLPIPGQRGQTREVKVHQVLVKPQALGALWAMAYELGDEAAADVQTSTNLVIDVGYGTLMWLMSRGNKPMLERSGANMGGVNSILRSVIQRIDPQLSGSPLFLSRIDDAIRNNKPVPNITEAAAQEFAPAIRHQVKSMFKELMKSVGAKADVDTIWLAGGGAHLYLEEVKANFPNHEVRTCSATDDPRFTNLKGLQLLAELKAAS